jgi:hypothetical protein
MKKIIRTIKERLNNLHIGHGIATLAIIAALAGTAATILPSGGTHSLALVSTISGAASTIISAQQAQSNIDKK